MVKLKVNLNYELKANTNDVMEESSQPLRTEIYHAKENIASVKIVKIEFNANLDLLGFPIL